MRICEFYQRHAKFVNSQNFDVHANSDVTMTRDCDHDRDHERDRDRDRDRDCDRGGLAPELPTCLDEAFHFR